MTKEVSYGEARKELSDKIKSKCSSCYFGRKNGKVSCRHSSHPGIVGGFGTEWALYCNHYTKAPEVKP